MPTETKTNELSLENVAELFYLNKDNSHFTESGGILSLALDKNGEKAEYEFSCTEPSLMTSLFHIFPCSTATIRK